MLRRLQLIRNVGRFHSCAGSEETDLSDLSLVYAENGRGKSTLAAILRSLASGHPAPILSRNRLGSEHEPNVVVLMEEDGPSVFEDGEWSRTEPNLVVFDDAFVDQNVCSGLSVGPSHRQGLHQVVVGREGVALAREIEDLNGQIEDAQQEIRTIEGRFNRDLLGEMSIADFCGLPRVPDVDEAISEARRRLAGLENAAAVREAAGFSTFTPPSLPVDEITAVLAATIDDIDKNALVAVRGHLGAIGENAEAWVASGVNRAERIQPQCPFCQQDLSQSSIFAHYRAYFSQEYESHRSQIADTRRTLEQRFSGDQLAQYERVIVEQRESHRFWSDYVDLPPFELDVEGFAGAWADARDKLRALLDQKAADPLAPVSIPDEVQLAADRYEQAAESIRQLSQSLQERNAVVAETKAEIAGGDLPAARQDLVRLERTQGRHSEEGNALANAWRESRQRKETMTQQKADLRERLDTHRDRVFPEYEQAINELLRRFNAGFRITRLSATNPRGQPSSEYFVEINGEGVPLSGDDTEGAPNFGTALSAGDRTTLAFAFFIASLRADPNLGDRVVVIDDPISSLDDYRTNTTAMEIRALAEEASQLLLLSHSKRLLCTVWEHAPQGATSALEIRRQGDGSDIVPWNVHAEAASDYDQRHEIIRSYVRDGGTRDDAKRVAGSLRPALEAYLRVACVEHFPPGTLLGRLIERARQALERGEPILSERRVAELDELRDYANGFHHDTNPAYDRALADLNEQELEGYARRVLDFTRMPED